MPVLLALFAAACLVGCGVGQGTGAAAGPLFVGQCDKLTTIGSPGAPVMYDLRPTYFVADPVNDLPHLNPSNRVTIRMQSSGNLVEEADVVYINIANVRLVAEQLGQPILVGPATNLRASLMLNRTCPREAVLTELDGTIQFSRFGVQDSAAAVPNDFRIQFGDTLTATFSFDVVDRRAIGLGGIGNTPVEPTVGGHLDGGFDFVVRQGRAAQSYP
jgi:hypothetical protein